MLPVSQLTPEQQQFISEQLIQHSTAIGRLLEDRSIQKVFADFDEKYVREWKSAPTPEAREAIWAQARALGDFKSVLEAAVQAGLHEAAKAEATAKARNRY